MKNFKYFFAFVVLISFTRLQATTIFVDINCIYDQNSNDVGTEWNKAFNSLQTALNELSNGDELRLAAGTYYIEPMVPGLNCTLGNFLIRDGISIKGSFQANGTSQNTILHPTIISGDLNMNGVWDIEDAKTLFQFSAIDENAETLLDHLIFEFSETAIQAEKTSYKVSNSVFRNMYTSTGVLLSTESQVSIENSVFENNVVSGKSASVIYSTNCQVDIVNSRFQYNNSSAYQAFAGSILMGNHTESNFTNCVFYNNDCSNDQLPEFLSNTQEITLVNCSFKGNDSPTPENSANLFLTAKVHNCAIRDDTSLYYLNETTAAANLELSHSFVPINFPLNSGIMLSHQDPSLLAPDLAIPTNSPAINSGNNAFNSTSSDVESNNRIMGVNGACIIDIGAYEFAGNTCASSRKKNLTEELTSEINIFPNPSTGEITIQSNEVISNIIILNQQGKLVKELNNLGSAATLQIDLSSFSNGIYLVQTRSNEKIKTDKLILGTK